MICLIHLIYSGPLATLYQRGSMSKDVFVVILIGFVTTLGIALPYPILAPLFLGANPIFFPLSDWGAIQTFALVLAAYPFGQFLGSPFLGFLSDRLGPKKVLSWSLALTVLGYGISVWAVVTESTLTLFFSRFLTGLTEGLIGIARSCLAHLCDHETKPKVYAQLNSAIVAGWFLGPLLGGILSDPDIIWFFSPLLAFIFAGLITLLSLIILLLWFPPIKMTHEHETEQSKNILQTLAQILNIKPLVVLLFASFMVTLGFDTLYQFYPIIVVKHFSGGSSEIVLVAMCMTSFMIFSQQVFAKRVNRKDPMHALFLQGLLFATVLYASIFSHSILFLCIYLGIAGITIGILATVLPVLVSDHAPMAHQGFVLNLMTGTRYLGDAGICLMGGLAAEELVQGPFYIAIIATLLGVLFLFFLPANK